MSSQRYERVRLPCSLSRHHATLPHHHRTPHTDEMTTQVAAHDNDDISTSLSPVPNSPPPSFRSRASSVRHSSSQERAQQTEQEQTLHDTFDAPSDDESDDEDTRDRRQLIQGDRGESRDEDENEGSAPRPGQVQRRVTEIPVFAAPNAASGRVYGGGNAANDGVFANLNAKPKVGEDLEEKPPVSTTRHLTS